MSDCIFCRIVAGSIPATLVGTNEHAIAFRDLHPQAPTHILVIPRTHVASLADPLPDATMAGVLGLAREVAAAEGLVAGGYRVVTNIGADGGQTVPHLHFHVLGGRAFHWPPG
ncbi:MAG: histidine triad nucleotide-binding protein [Gemmatimonadaceae bacterium]|nr:histidine triad nucleotide-binding protein [Gemmatimonadaceae bacterium]